MSTILKALEKRRVEREAGPDPEAILERNAALREAARRGPAATGRLRWSAVLAAVSLVLVLACVIGTTWVLMNNTGRRGATIPPSEEASPTPTPTIQSAQPERPAPTSTLRETVRLRTRPLLRSAPAGEPSEVYAAGPQASAPMAAPPPVATPQAALVFPPPPDRAATTTAAATAQDPNVFLRLTGILRDPKRPAALINDEIVRVGDVVEGVKVLAIDNSSSVRVEYKGKQYDLELK